MNEHDELEIEASDENICYSCGRELLYDVCPYCEDEEEEAIQ